MDKKITSISDQDLISEVEKRGLDNILDKVLVRLTGKDDYEKSYKQMMKVFISCVAVFSFVVLFGSILVCTTMINMKKTYISETDKILFMNNKMKLTSDWEKLSSIERKEKLRSQYYTIIKYYNPSALTEDQILDSFNSLWIISEKYNSISFFMPLAYIRYSSNFDINYDKNSRKGFAGMYLIDYERFSKMYDQNDPITSISYRGIDTSRNPSDSIKLLYLKMNYFYKYFNGRVDWVYFAMMYNEFDVIEKFWKNGKGEIPDEYYLKGDLANMLNCYHSFINFEIPKKDQK